MLRIIFFLKLFFVSTEIRDIFGLLDNSPQPALPPKQNQAAAATTASGAARPSSEQRERISNSLIALPRPPSRHGSAIAAAASGQQQQRNSRTSPSPAPLSLARQDSSSLSVAPQQQQQQQQPSSSSHSASFGTSRGPSPLTLGLSDVVPLAVAFQEICHACFRGADEDGCQVRLIGDMMVSFPAGIVQLVASNPNPAPLQFRIKNAGGLESVVPNKHLISQ